MASEEDFTITTKGGHTITFPDRDGTVATESATPVKPATSGQAQTIIDELGNQTYGLSAIKTAVGGITIPNDYATSTQATSIVNKLDNSMYGLSTIMGKVSDNYSVIQGLDAVVHDVNHGNSALKTKLDTIDTRLTDNTNGLTKIREAADAAKNKAIDIYTLAEGSTGFDAIYNELTDHEHGLNELSGAIAGIANNIDDPMHGLMVISGELVTIKNGVNSIHIPSDYATSTQATSIISLQRAEAIGVSHISETVDSINDMADDIVNKLDDNTNGLASIKSDVAGLAMGTHPLNTAVANVGIDASAAASNSSNALNIVTNATYGNQAIKNALADSTNGLVAIKATATVAASQSTTAATQAANAAGTATNIYNYITSNSTGLPKVTDSLDNIAYQVATVDTTVGQVAGMTSNINDVVTSNTYGLRAIKGAVDSIDSSVSNIYSEVTAIDSEVTAIGCGIWDIQHDSTYGLEQIKNVLDDTYHDCSGAYVTLEDGVMGLLSNTIYSSGAYDFLNSSTHGIVSLKDRLVALSGTLGNVQTVLDNINGANI